MKNKKQVIISLSTLGLIVSPIILLGTENKLATSNKIGTSLKEIETISSDVIIPLNVTHAWAGGHTQAQAQVQTLFDNANPSITDRASLEVFLQSIVNPIRDLITLNEEIENFNIQGAIGVNPTGMGSLSIQPHDGENSLLLASLLPLTIGLQFAIGEGEETVIGPFFPQIEPPIEPPIITPTPIEPPIIEPEISQLSNNEIIGISIGLIIFIAIITAIGSGLFIRHKKNNKKILTKKPNYVPPLRKK